MSEIYLKNGIEIEGSNGPFLSEYYYTKQSINFRYTKCIPENIKLVYYSNLGFMDSLLEGKQGWMHELSSVCKSTWDSHSYKWVMLFPSFVDNRYGSGRLVLVRHPLYFYGDRNIPNGRGRWPTSLTNEVDGLSGLTVGLTRDYDILSPTPTGTDPEADPETDPEVEVPTESPRHEVLRQVETIDITPSGNLVEQDGSDSKATLNTINSESLHIGSLAPGETSKTKIIRLKVPASIGIENIKIGLIDTGDINFEDNIFGVETLNYLDYNFVPSKFFKGVNLYKKSTSSYNINIPNDGFQKSQYVYLNMRLPSNHGMGGGTIRYKWFFDYESGVSATDSTGGGDAPDSDDGMGSNPSEPFEFPSIIISGSNNPDVNGTYEIGRIFGGTNDVGDLHVQYFKENLGEPSPEDYNNGYVMILYLYLDNNRLSFGKNTSAPKPWNPDCSYPTLSEVWGYSLSLDQVSEWDDIDGKILENIDYSGTGDSSPLFPSNPYPNDTLMITVV